MNGSDVSELTIKRARRLSEPMIRSNRLHTRTGRVSLSEPTCVESTSFRRNRRRCWCCDCAIGILAKFKLLLAARAIHIHLLRMSPPTFYIDAGADADAVFPCHTPRSIITRKRIHVRQSALEEVPPTRSEYLCMASGRRTAPLIDMPFGFRNASYNLLLRTFDVRTHLLKGFVTSIIACLVEGINSPWNSSSIFNMASTSIRHPPKVAESQE
jgi:hypothetical protein